MKLTEKEYWDEIYRLESNQYQSPSWKGRFKNLFKKLVRKKYFNYLENYSEYLIWEVIYRKYLPAIKSAKVLEVGSAPGEHLIKLKQRFDFIPYGVEYSKIGFELNRQMFLLNDINPDNVIYADFLAEEFQARNQEYFDIVISRGFIEHFSEVENIIEKHNKILKKGGYLVITIPNLRGVNYLLSEFFNKGSGSIHNLNIMSKGRFQKLFKQDQWEHLFCNYYGTFNFNLFNAKSGSPMRLILFCCKIIQLILNIIFRLLFNGRGFENKRFSPYLIFIGRKKG